MRILTLEDDLRFRAIVVRRLMRSGHTVDVAATIDEARWLRLETTHNVLVLDVMFPDGDGFGWCRELARPATGARS